MVVRPRVSFSAVVQRRSRQQPPRHQAGRPVQIAQDRLPDGGHLCVGLRPRDAGLQPRDDLVILPAAFAAAPRPRGRPDISRRAAVKICRHHADDQKLIAALCLRAGRNLTKEEWSRYIGSDTPWQPSCRDHPSNWRTPDP